MNEVKVNIIYNSSSPLNSHTNISPFNSSNPDIVIGNIISLDDMYDNGELSEIIALDTIEYLPHTKINEIISNWVSKLKVGGKLILGFVEAYEVCNGYNRGMINQETLNLLLHGKQDKPHLVKLSSYTAIDLIENLQKQHTIKLMKHTLNGVDCTITLCRYR
jgi:hypothetical protein